MFYSQEAIYEIYQQLQEGGDPTLLSRYEGMIGKVIHDMNQFNQEKAELEKTLRQ